MQNNISYTVAQKYLTVQNKIIITREQNRPIHFFINTGILGFKRKKFLTW